MSARLWLSCLTRNEDDAAALANGTDYGLSAEVYSADRDHAGRFPFRDTKLPGYGRELGALGLAEMTEVTAVMS
jgi:acyl-CoA reductase-like NAD-dependent aldehyde dehydrogenase